MTVETDGPAPREILRFRLTGGTALIAAVRAAILEAVAALGSAPEEAEQLAEIAATLAREIATHDFTEGTPLELDIVLAERPDELLVWVDDHAVPRDLRLFRQGPDTVLGRMLADGYADALRWIRRGREGNRAELVRRRPTPDVRRQLPIEEHHRCRNAPAVDETTPIEVRFLAADESLKLARAVYRSYGYSYDADWVYEPERVARRIASGHLCSVVAIDGDDEVVGHLGLSRDPSAGVAEAGQAVVDPRYRGHHLFTTLKRFAADWAREQGLFGLFSEATAAHPYSQKANRALGARETGLLLGYIPATVRYEQLDPQTVAPRRSVTLFYLKTNEAPDRRLHVPARHRPMVERILAGGGLAGSLDRASEAGLGSVATRLDVQVRRDHNQATMVVLEAGGDVAARVGTELRDLCLHHLDCIYVDLPLGSPASAAAGTQLDSLGFRFGGIFPNRSVDGHVLRLQYLNNVAVRRSDVVVVSDLGRELLTYVCPQTGK